MAKRVELTEQERDFVKAKCGQDVDFNQLVFYRARGISTEPISQNTIYDGGVLTREALADFVKLINDPLENVSLQTMHDTTVLPVGKVIHADLVDEGDDVSAVYTLFAASTAHPDIIAKMDNGVIDEVSFGFTPKKILCSECGKNFLDPDVDLWDILTHHCPECDAIMGQDGAHVVVPAVKTVSELSLVNRGAAKHAKILDNVYQMAMSADKSETITLTKEGMKNDLLKLNLCSTISKEEVDMTPEELTAAIEAAMSAEKAEQSKLQSTIASLGEEKKALEEAKQAAEEAKAALEGEKAALAQEKADLETALEEAKKKVENIQGAFDAEIQKVLVAAGLSETVPAELEEKLELLKKAHLTLANIPVDGVSKPADKLEKENNQADFSAYKVK